MFEQLVKNKSTGTASGPSKYSFSIDIEYENQRLKQDIDSLKQKFQQINKDVNKTQTQYFGLTPYDRPKTAEISRQSENMPPNPYSENLQFTPEKKQNNELKDFLEMSYQKKKLEQSNTKRIQEILSTDKKKSIKQENNKNNEIENMRKEIEFLKYFDKFIGIFLEKKMKN